jgi:uroporphyrin-III C-methyltransferase/precorrin-2 dehydrogenase/sirohydrochlorin ferrochelatase
VRLAEWLALHRASVLLIGSATTETKQIRCEARAVSTDDIDHHWLVIAAGDDPAVNRQVLDWCDQRNRFCYNIDNPQHASWMLSQTDHQQHGQHQGKVALVGAGPGDPELLTLRALRLIQEADVIVYDRLVSKPIMARCNPAAEFIYAGKAKSNHTLPQESINDLLVTLAQRPANVVRLKGGDPFIFGRGGEEIETLAEKRVPFQVVPGITAASGCAAFAGIPLTHRDHAQSVVFVTGHLRNGEINLNWNELVSPQLTVVVYMGLTGLEQICAAMITHGRAADTPAALVQQGTQPQQRVLASTLEHLPTLVARSEVSAPTMLIIGHVVTLHDKLDWFSGSNSAG